LFAQNSIVNNQDGISISSSLNYSENIIEDDNLCNLNNTCCNINSAITLVSQTVFVEFPIFLTYLNRAKKLRISEISRICTGFNSFLKV